MFIVLLAFSTSEAGADMANRRTNSVLANCTTLGLADIDNDNICDSWETGGNMVVNHPTIPSSYTYNCGAGSADLVCPTTSTRDIFVEVDCLTGQCPSPEAIDLVKTAFSQVTDASGRPFALHVQINVDTDNNLSLTDHNSGTSIATSETRFPGSNTSTPTDLRGFDQIKSRHFGTVSERGLAGWDTDVWREKQQVFHYALFVHWQYNNHGASGTGETYGNDFMVSLGNWAGGVGSTQEQAGTFMHELGHNLNLKHGGGDTTNCKPNYLSVMSYSRQMADLVPSRDVDYSGRAMGPQPDDIPDVTLTLTENNLIETNGVDSYAPHSEEQITYGPNPPAILPWTNTGIDWNLSGGPLSGTVIPAININGLPGCGSTSSSDNLVGYNDWANIQLNFRSQGNAQDGVLDPPACIPPSCFREISGGVSDEAIPGPNRGEYTIPDDPPRIMNIRVIEDGGLQKNHTLAYRDLRLDAVGTCISDYQNKTGDEISGYKENLAEAGSWINQDVLYKVIRSLNKIKYAVLPTQAEHARNDVAPKNECDNKITIIDAVDSVIESNRLAAHFTPNESHPAPFSDGSPRQQEALGVPPNELKCNDSLEPVIRNLDGAEACINKKNIGKFEMRGWTLASTLKG